MKRWVLLLLLIFFVCIPIVFEQDQGDMLQNMAAREAGSYHVYVFWEGEDNQPGKLLESIRPSFDDREAINIAVWDFIRLNDETDPHAYFAKALNITQSPTYVVFDHKGIVLRTHASWELSLFLLEGGEQVLKR